jgi:hypothetical protein
MTALLRRELKKVELLLPRPRLTQILQGGACVSTLSTGVNFFSIGALALCRLLSRRRGTRYVAPGFSLKQPEILHRGSGGRIAYFQLTPL